jgi:hypothetical protein
MILSSQHPDMVRALDNAEAFRQGMIQANADDMNNLYYLMARLYRLALRQVMPPNMADRILDGCMNNGENVRYQLSLMVGNVSPN